ncbi:MAG: ribbon-helix-helix domain-containing protein [Woeseiaceae bacterium]
MASSLNLSLTDELREFIDSRTGDRGLYATPSEYVRDLIRRDMVLQENQFQIQRALNEALRELNAKH